MWIRDVVSGIQKSCRRCEINHRSNEFLSKSLLAIYSRSLSHPFRRQAEARKDALRRSQDYKLYLTRLVTIGYFRDEIEGSQAWNELENKAADIYVEIRREEYVHKSMSDYRALG